jgi:hypothetical protein
MTNAVIPLLRRNNNKTPTITTIIITYLAQLSDLCFTCSVNRAHSCFKPDDKLWHQQHEKLLEHERKNGHCRVPQKKHKDDKSLGVWVSHQRARHAKNKMLPDRKSLLDALNFVWKADAVATRPSTKDVRGLAN